MKRTGRIKGSVIKAKKAIIRLSSPGIKKESSIRAIIAKDTISSIVATRLAKK